MIATLINIVALACAMLILWRTEPAIARMDRGTHWMIRYAMLLITAGALIIIGLVISGTAIDFQTAILLAGIALLLICERRLRFLVPHRQRSHHA